MAYWKHLLFGLIIFAAAHKCATELFTAVDEMSSLLHVEAAVIQKLKSYIADQETKLISLKEYGILIQKKVLNKTFFFEILDMC